LVIEHPSGWVAPIKLAEMAAQDGLAQDWDRWLREALSRGFTLGLVADNPAWAAQWRPFVADPELGDIARRLAAVFGEEASLERLKNPQ
jgi:hypothetical protein